VPNAATIAQKYSERPALFIADQPLSQRIEGTGTLSTDKIPYATINEWALALKWHPDLARDLRETRAFIAHERRYKRLWERGREGWGPLSAMMFPGKPLTPMPDSRSLPMVMAAAWLHRRYKPLWDNAPTLPTGTIQNALHAAVEAGACEPAAAIIQQTMIGEGEIRKRTGFVRADVFVDVESVQTPEWVARVRNAPSVQALLHAGAWAEDLPPYPAILLTITPDGTLPQAVKALEAAWENIKPALNPQIGTRPGKNTQGRIPEFVRYVTLYRLYRQWSTQRVAQGATTSQTAFAKAMSTRRLPLQQRAIKIHAATGGQLSERLAWLITASPGSSEYIAKLLRDDVLPVLGPHKNTPSLHESLGIK